MYCEVMYAYPGEERTVDADFALTRSAAAGDPAAERQLLERVWPRVRKTCQCLGGDCGEGEDFTQLALIEVIRSAGSFRGESSLEYWVDRITVQTAAKEFQRKSRRKKLADAVWQPGPVTRTVDETAAASRMRQRLSTHFQRLSEKYRTAVVLHHLYDYEVSEIAEMTESNINTIRGRLRRGLRKLREAILADPVLREWIEERMS